MLLAATAERFKTASITQGFSKRNQKLPKACSNQKHHECIAAQQQSLVSDADPFSTIQRSAASTSLAWTETAECFSYYRCELRSDLRITGF